MTLLKSGVNYSPVIISRMIFVCSSCEQIDIVSEKDYTPNTEKECPKCQNIMVLKSANTTDDSIKITVKAIEGNESNESNESNEPNRGCDYFDKPSQK